MSNEKLREALQRIQYKAVSLADAQVIALEALALPATPPAAAPAPAVPQWWKLVIPGRLRTDQWDSARVGDYNNGWNDCLRKVTAALESLATPAAPSQEPVTLRDSYAGVIAWIGDKQCKLIVTEDAIKHEHTPGVVMRNTAHQCVQEVIIAALREKESGK